MSDTEARSDASDDAAYNAFIASLQRQGYAGNAYPKKSLIEALEAVTRRNPTPERDGVEYYVMMDSQTGARLCESTRNYSGKTIAMLACGEPGKYGPMIARAMNEMYAAHAVPQPAETEPVAPYGWCIEGRGGYGFTKEEHDRARREKEGYQTLPLYAALPVSASATPDAWQYRTTSPDGRQSPWSRSWPTRGEAEEESRHRLLPGHTIEFQPLYRAPPAPALATSEMVEVGAGAILARDGFGFYTDPMEGGQDAYDITCDALDTARLVLDAALARSPSAGATGSAEDMRGRVRAAARLLAPATGHDAESGE